MNVKSHEKMGMMYSRDWVTLSDNYAEGRAKEEGVPSASSGVPKCGNGIGRVKMERGGRSRYGSHLSGGVDGRTHYYRFEGTTEEA